MRIVTGVVAIVVVGLIAFACAHRGGLVVDPAAELVASEDAVHATIAGAVVDAADGEGIEGVTVALRDAAGTLAAESVSRVDGRFIFPALPAGAYRVTVIAGGRTVTRTATVGAGQRWQPRLAIDGEVDLSPTWDLRRGRMG